MAIHLTVDEIDLLNTYESLFTNGQKELKEYMRYLLCKQYRREVMAAVFNNRLMDHLFHGLLHIIESKDFDIELAAKRIGQIKELYFSNFQKIHFKYCELVENLDSNETVRQFGCNGFENIERAIKTGDVTIIRLEIIEFFDEYQTLSQKKDARKIIAV